MGETMFRPISFLCVFVLALTLNFRVAVGQNDAKTYRCAAKDVVSLQDNGTLGKDAVTEAHRKRIDGILIDTLTGAITYPDGSREVWSVIRKGSDANDYVLMPRSFYQQDAKEAAVTAATDFIRVRAWSREPQVKFMVFALSILLTGTCEIVR
jgi:hypothetical protein